ncbi:hypothetical protein ACFV4N_07695 [Actinosynnema sp. NPDC059797]
MSVATEAARIRDLFQQVEEIEEVASSLSEDDERRRKLHGVVAKALRGAPPVRPVVAGELLALTEKTVKAWAREGVLAIHTQEPRMLLDATRLHEVLHVVGELRRAGRTRGLLDEVHRRLSDTALLERADLAASLAQMNRGEGRVVR